MVGIQERLGRAIGDRYDILREIGAGAMGSVYIAEDRKLGRKVAIKVLHPELVAEGVKARFLREIRIVASLAHPNIVPVHDSGEADGLLYFVMRFQEGESLRDLIDREGALPVSRAVAIARDVAAGLAYAHDRDVIHRDIKPANILLTGDHAVIADFGVARAVEPAGMGDTSATFATLGTPLYMSPEQASDSHDLDGRSDVYSLGCVLYEMLTGEGPHMAKGVAAILASHLHKTVPSLGRLRSDVPLPLAEAVDRALAKSPDDRFEGAGEMCSALEKIQAGIGTTGLGVKAWWHWLPRRARRLVLVLGIAVLVLPVVLLGRAVLAPGDSTLDPAAMVVVSFRDAVTTSTEEELVVGLADELIRQLNSWESVRAISQIALSGARFDLGLEDPTLDRIDEGLALAKRVGAGTLVALSARARADSVLLSADVYDVGTGRAEGRTNEAWADARDPNPAAEEVARLILGLGAVGPEVVGGNRPSAVPEALIAYDSGRRALEAWNLPDAEAAFREAVRWDPAFAMAHHLLAFTLYWEWEEGLTEEDVVGPQISRESRLALRNSAGLSLLDSLHICAFNDYQVGDYDAAREEYRVLLDRDSTDVYAWALQGSVELRDPWLKERPGGGFEPRSDLNLARRSFAETVRLSPGFEGAYGRLFEIAEKVVSEGTPAFEVPRNEYIPPYAHHRPVKLRAFAPVYLDSLIWVEPEARDTLPQEVISVGAAELLEESLDRLRRWAAFEPDEPRPQRELALWTLSLRSRLAGPHPPSLVDSLSREALRYQSRALALSPDTQPSELLLLANLHLATWDLKSAQRDHELSLTWFLSDTTSSMPSSASNVLLYSGRSSRALHLLPLEVPRSIYIPDPDSGGLLDGGGAWLLVQRLRILGSTGVMGAPLEGAFRDLQALWANAADLSPRQIRVLRAFTAPFLVVPLSMEPTALGSWIDGLDLGDPLWTLLASDDGGTDELLAEAVRTEAKEIEDPDRSFLLATMAEDRGDPALALRLFSRLDSLVYGVEGRDVGWGLLALSYLYRGRNYSALGDSERAAEFYRRFTEAWPHPDLPVALVEEARRGLAEMR